MKILVVDDSRVMRQIVGRTLRQAGFTGHEVVEASDGVEGLAAVAAHQPSLVLSDWNMPNMSGLDMLATLRERGCATPVVFVTSEGSPEMAERAEAAGALCVLAKPFTPDRFREKLAGVLA